MPVVQRVQWLSNKRATPERYTTLREIRARILPDRDLAPPDRLAMEGLRIQGV